MRLLVVGKSGQLAHALQDCAERSGPQVICYGRPDLDLTKPETLEKVFNTVRPDVVINAAAYTAVDLAESEPDQAFALNADGAGHLARICRESERPLIHISTDYVFDGIKSEPYLETDSTHPLGVYGASKLEGEQRVIDASPGNIVLRTAWVHSPYQNNFVKTMLRLAADQETIPVVDDQLGSPTYAPHLAQAILALSDALLQKSPPASGGVFHMAGQGATSWYGLATEVFRLSKSYGGPFAEAVPIGSESFKTAAARPKNSRLNCAKIADAFDIVLPDWRVGVSACVKRVVAQSTDTKS